MSLYLDRLTEEFEAITTGINDTLDRAADESRELSTDEAETVNRSQVRAEELRKSIEHFGTIEETRNKVNAVRAKVPTEPVQRSASSPKDEESADAKLLREFPTAGDYISTVARAKFKDPAAVEKLNRAAQNQLLADNPGIVPRPILAPVITLVDNERPFIQSISQKRLVAGSFDRPVISQHVQVGIQATEKTEVVSRKMKIDKLPVNATTYAGQLDISRQDIKWTQPGILQLVTEDFGHEYAQESDADACSQFVASVAAAGPPVALPDFTAAAVVAGLFQGATKALGNGENAGMPDTLWVSPDVWGALGGLMSPNGNLIFPSLNPSNTQGNTLGLKLVVDGHFAAGTMILGPGRFSEWYEDVDGLVTVEEPNLVGLLVGYAGFGAFLNTAPQVYTAYTVDVAPEGVAATSKTASK